MRGSRIHIFPSAAAEKGPLNRNFLLHGKTHESPMPAKKASVVDMQNYLNFIFIDIVLQMCYSVFRKGVSCMSQTTVSIRMDDDLKRNFDHICNELGMSMSTAVTMLAKKMTREQRLPFELSVDPFYSEQNMARLRKSIAEMEATGGTIHEVPLDD